MPDTMLHALQCIVSPEPHCIPRGGLYHAGYNPSPPTSAAQNNKGLFLAHAAHVNMGCALCSPPSGTHADGVANISIVTWHQGRWQRNVLKVVPQQFSVTTQEAIQVILQSQLTGQNASHDPSQPQEGQEMPSFRVLAGGGR